MYVYGEKTPHPTTNPKNSNKQTQKKRKGAVSEEAELISKRFPLKKPIRHGSILNRESPADKKQRVERSASHDFDPTGLVQRCVIIQKGDNGFGLTVSGDNPVFVQSVKEDGAAMRAGVQTGDRIIKVNGTLVTHSNHLEVVKLIKSGSYVALTVQGRPPGMPQIPLADSEGEPSVTGHMSPLMTSPHSPGASGNMERITSPVLMGEENSVVHNQKVEILRKMLQKEQERLQLLQEDYNRAPTPKLLKEIQEAKKLLPQLQEQLSRAAGPAQDGAVLTSSRPCSDTHAVSEVEADPEDGLGRVDCSSGDASWPSSDNAESPKSGLKEGVYLEENLEKNDVIQDTDTQSLIGSPAARTAPHIIGAEDDDFGTEHEQINGQCSCFQSIELLKSRPAHLAVFLHHVVSQFDPATLLCYLYSDLYKQTNSKETRRIFLEFHQFFLDRSAHLKVSVPDEISVDLEKRRPELIPEDLHRHYIHTMQERVHPEIQRHLEDFRQKRSMGLTLAESELTKLDVERDKDRVTLEKERACAEQIVAKIEEVLMTAQAIEEDKSSAAQYVILMYMKHLGVRVKEPRSLEQKRGRIGFLPKIKAAIISRVQCRIVALDLRGHGETKVKNSEDLSAETMAKDVGNVIEAMYGDLPPPIMLIGHSMGGAIAVHTASSNLVPSLLGLCVIDVVEGTAMDALNSMQNFLRGRPKTFKSLENAIEWSVKSGQIRNLESARVSMVGQVKECEGITSPCIGWSLFFPSK